MFWFLVYSGLGILLSIFLGLFPKSRWTIVFIGIVLFASAFLVAQEQEKREDHFTQTVCNAARKVIKEEISNIEELPELKKIKNYLETLGLSPNDCLARLEKGTKLDRSLNLILKQRFEEAASLLKENANESRHEAATSYYYLGNALYHATKYSEAADAFRGSVILIPYSPEAWTNCGVALHKLGKKEKALQKYTKALSVRPGFARALYSAGVVLQELGKLEEAIDKYKAAVKNKPDYWLAWLNWGSVLNELGKHEEALVKHLEAKRLNPNSELTHYNLGNDLAELDRHKEAIEEYREAIRLDPNVAQTHYNLGNQLSKLERYKEAIEEYQKAVNVNPDFDEAPLLYNNWGRALIKLKKYEEGIAVLKKALEMRPKLASAYFLLGESYRYLGKDDQAIANYRKAMELDVRYRTGAHWPGRYYEQLRFIK